MRRSPNKQDPHLTLVATLLTLCMLFLALAPAAAAADVRGGARDMRRTHAPMRMGLRVENGIVTDEDGIIGNGTRGADRDLHRHHRHRSHPTMSEYVVSAAAVFPDMPQNGTNGTGTADSGMGNMIGDITNGVTNHGRSRTLPDESGDPAADGAVDNGTAPNDGANDGNANNGTVNDGTANDSDADNEDGMIGDGNAQNGVIEQEDGTANDGLMNDGIANDDVAEGATEDGNATARSILPWIIAIIVILAAVLVILALMPKRRRPR